MTTILIIVAALAAILYGWYAAVIAARNKVGEALGGIDAQLQQRHDLIPNVLTIARRFMEHEATLLEEITNLRAQAQPRIGERDFSRIAEKFQTEAALTADMTRFFALAENYPQLTSSGPMMEAQRTYREVEAHIAAARRFYNNAVNTLKNRVETFPGPVVAGVAGVRTLPPFYEAVEGAEKPVAAADHL
ncbi:MAG: LemA family protein [Devosia sp.]|uniref:LemA family protein n=1 Tax=Devosia sp. TaxID=1871048 RepID=UPI0024C825FC|nr:LemA family protein [Devosia sp.]UYN99837.1 MAG: LemA family protein [Devosia sp.]